MSGLGAGNDGGCVAIQRKYLRGAGTHRAGEKLDMSELDRLRLALACVCVWGAATRVCVCVCACIPPARSCGLCCCAVLLRGAWCGGRVVRRA